MRIPVLGDPGDFVIAHLEHRSSADETMPIRLLAYRGALAADRLRELEAQAARAARESQEKHGRKAKPPARDPSVVQVVVAHDAGSHRPWTVSLRSADAIGLGAVTRSEDWPFKTWQDPVLLDLEITALDQLRAMGLTTPTRVGLVLFKIAPGNPAIARDLLPWAGDLREVGRFQRSICQEMLKYAWLTSQANKDELIAFMRQAGLGPEIEEGFMASAQAELAESEARGEARGRAQGEARGEAKGLIAGERRTVRMAVKARGLTLTRDQSNQIDGCEDIAVLQGWAEAAVTAKSTDQIFR